MSEIIVPDTIRVMILNGRVSVMKLETYLTGAVAMAIGATAPLEALKAQAVASRTYAARAKRHAEQYADVCTHAHCMKWKRVDPIVAPEVFRAVSETWGTVALYHGELIEAFYFENCAGRTRDAEEMAMPAQPYLRGVDCPCGFTEMKGHGVGMCQRGAIVMARQGANFKDILKHYYRDIEVVQTRTDVSPILPDETPLPTRKPRSAPHPKVSKPATPTPPPDEFSALIDSLNQAIGITPPVEKPAPPKPRVAVEKPQAAPRPPSSEPAPAAQAPAQPSPPVPAPTQAPSPAPAASAEPPASVATAPTESETAISQPSVSVAPPLGTIHVDNLPGPRMIAGCLARTGVEVEIEDARGWKMHVFSGSAPHYGEGGFEIAVQDDGYFTIRIESKVIEVSLREETVFLREETAG